MIKISNISSRFIHTGCYSKDAYALFNVITNSASNFMTSNNAVWYKMLDEDGTEMDENFTWDSHKLATIKPIRSFDNEILLVGRSFKIDLLSDFAKTYKKALIDSFAFLKKSLEWYKIKICLSFLFHTILMIFLKKQMNLSMLSYMS